MIDDRGKPPDGSGGDESVEILADAAVAARRRPTRKLRVPNDPVPRRVDADSESGAEESASSSAFDAEPTGESAADRELPDDPPTTPSVPVPARARVSMRPGASSPPRPASVPPPRAPSMPPPPRVPSFQPPTPSLLRDEYDLTETTMPSMSVLDIGGDNPPSIPPPAAPSLPPSAPSLPPGTPSMPPGASDDGGVVVRQVRRRIKSVGTGSKPPPPRPVVEDTPSIIIDEQPDAGVPVPAVASMDMGDDFAVPPVETPAPEVRPISEPPHFEASDLSETDISIDETSDAEEEVLDEPTEEISIPEELLDRDRRPPVPAAARGSVPDAPKKPPAPPPAPPKSEKPAAKEKEREKPREESPAPERKKRRPWWEQMFNDDYFRTMPKYSPSQIKAEGDFIEQSLGVEKGAVVLDIACGDGRQAIELATRGYEMIALDLSLPMLSRAADSAQDREAKLNFIHADMREMEFNEMFDAAYCTSTSFGYFDDEKNLDVVLRMHRALKVGGTLLLDVINRDYALQSQPSMTWFEADGCVCMEETSFDYIKSRLQVKRTMIMDDGRQKEAEANIRLYSLHELGLMLHQSGFRIVEVSGSYRTAGAFFGAASKQIIILAQKQRRTEGTTATFNAAATTPQAVAPGASVSVPPAPPSPKDNGSKD